MSYFLAIILMIFSDEDVLFADFAVQYLSNNHDSGLKSLSLKKCIIIICLYTESLSVHRTADCVYFIIAPWFLSFYCGRVGALV